MIGACLVTLCLSTQTSEPIQHTDLLTVSSAVESAYCNRPDIKRACHDVHASREAEHVALAGYLPQITVSAGAGKASPRNIFQPKRFARLSFTQLIYSAAGPIQLYRIARQDTRALEFQELALRNKVRMETETALLDMWFAHHKKKFITWEDKASTSFFQKSMDEFEYGLTNPDTFWSHRATFAERQADVASYSDFYAVNKNTLEKSIGSLCPPDEALDNQDVTAFIENSVQKALDDQQPLEYWCAHGIEKRWELKALEERMIQEQYRERYYYKTYFPTVSLFTNFNKYKYQSAPLLSIVETGWSAGMVMDWCFDGLANIFNAGVSEERSYSYLMQYVDALQSGKHSIAMQYAELKQTLKLYNAAQEVYRQSENNIKLKRAQAETGILSPVDLDVAEALWAKQENDFLMARVTVAKQYRTLLYTCGYPES